MDLEPTVPQPNRPWGLTFGVFTGALAVVLLWSGFHSVLIGWAYRLEMGAWMPIFVGLLLVLAGLPLLVQALRQVKQAIWPPEPDRSDDIWIGQ